MGTNYYFMIKSKKLARDNFGIKSEYGNYMDETEYEIVDEPFLGYRIHLNKCSCGWRSLFQRHKAFKTFKELENFYMKNQKSIRIFDEYDQEFTWEEYKEIVIEHSIYEKPVPMKWVYDVNKICGRPGWKYLQTVKCSEDEAELYLPFNHKQHYETEKEAGRRLGVQVWDSDMDYGEDPDYPIDWTTGEFS